MTRTQLLLLIALMGLIQMAWLIATWRKRGFAAALGLFVYGALSAWTYALQTAIEGE